MILTTKHPGPMITTVAAALTLALSGCTNLSPSADSDSSEHQQPASAVYQFDELRVADADAKPPISARNGGAMTLQLSDELKGVIPQGNSVAVGSYKVTSRPFTTGICAMDIEVDYVDGGKDAVKAAFPAETGGLGPAQMSVDYDAVEANRVAFKLTGERQWDLIVVDQLPGDDDLAKRGVYLRADYEAMTFVDKCATTSDAWTGAVMFPFVQPLERVNSYPDREFFFAGAAIGVIGGDAMKITGSVPHAEVSVSGKWAAKTKA